MCLAIGCGGATGETHHAKTPDEIIAEQERLGAKGSGDDGGDDYAGDSGDYDIEGDSDKAQPFDDKQADTELKRAARSAETCGGVVEGGPRGIAKVNLIFGNNGHVKESSIESPFEETDVGACVLRAMDAVIVPAFSGPDKAIPWEIDVKEGGAKEPKK